MADGPRLLVIGTSNSVATSGYVKAMAEAVPSASLHTACLGMCPSDLFAYRRAFLDPDRFDLAVLDFACNDGALLGGRMTDAGRIADAIGTAVSELTMAGCLPVLVILPLEGLRGRPNPVRAIYRDLAARHALPFLDGYALLDRLAGTGAPPFRLFRDNMHLEPAVSSAVGRCLGAVLTPALEAVAPGTPEAWEGGRLRFADLPSSALASAESTPLRLVTRGTGLIEAELVMVEGGAPVAMRLEPGWEAISVVADFSLCRGILALEGDGETSIFLSRKEGDRRDGKPTLAIWPLARPLGGAAGVLRFSARRDGPVAMNASRKSAPLEPGEDPVLAVAGVILRRREAMPWRRMLPEAMDLCALVPDLAIAAERARLAG